MKRGQISIFLIVSLVTVIAVGTILFARHALLVKQPVIDPFVEPVKRYTQTCIESTARNGLDRIGQQAGYVVVPQFILSDSRAYANYGPLKIPFWFLDGQERIPSFEYIQSELASYVEKNIGRCLQNYSYFENDFIIDTGEPKVKVSVTEEDVIVELAMDVSVSDRLQEKKVRLQKFEGAVNVPLKRMYQLASDILQAENERAFFENVTIDLMAMNENIPFTGFEFKCGKLQWKLTDIQKEIDDMLYFHLPKVRFKGTDFEPFLAPDKEYEYFRQFTLEKAEEGKYPDKEPPEDAWDYFHLVLPLEGKYPGFRAGTLYPHGQMQIRARPSDGNTLYADSGSGPSLLRFVCFQLYHFSYDVNYPVIVYVRDDTSGYVFRFAIPVIVDHNAPDRTSRSFGTYQAPIPFSGACDSLNGIKYSISASGFDTVAGIPDFPLIANISFHCYKYRCELGRTLPDEDAAGKRRLLTQLPDNCVGGYVIAEADGYLPAQVQVTTDKEASGIIQLQLTAVKNLSLDIVKKPVFYETGEVRDEQLALREDESVLLTLRAYRIPELLPYPDYFVQAYFDGNVSQNDDTASVKLIAADTLYRLDATLIRKARGNVGSSSSNIGGSDNNGDRIIGGWRGNFTISAADVLAGKAFRLAVADIRPTPITDAQLGDAVVFLEENDNYRQQLRPKVIS